MAQSKGGSKITLHYFDLVGRAEHIRYLFAAKELVYENHIVTDWENFKPKTPLGGLPVLEVDGQMVGQSLAAGRLAAKLTGLYGQGAIGQALVDSLVDVSNEVREAAIPVFFMPDGPEKDEKRKDFLEKKIPAAINNFNKYLKENDYLVNNKLSWADIHFFHAFEVVENIGFKDVLGKEKQLSALYKKIAAIPGIAKYRKNRPKAKK